MQVFLRTPSCLPRLLNRGINRTETCSQQGERGLWTEEVGGWQLGSRGCIRRASVFPEPHGKLRGSSSPGEEGCFRVVNFDYFLQQDFKQLHSGSFTPNEHWCLDMKTTLFVVDGQLHSCVPLCDIYGRIAHTTIPCLSLPPRACQTPAY